MTEQELQELKEKLAEFAGFRYGKFDCVSSLSSELNGVVTGWLSPEATSEPYKSEHFSKELPDFPQSLDACFKYLMPEVHRTLGDKEFFKFLVRWCMKVITEGNEALALCLETEKLVDGS